MKKWGSVTSSLMKSQGRPLTIHSAVQAGLLAYLKPEPWEYQDEMCLYLFDDWSIVLSQSIISRTLARMKSSLQVLKKKKAVMERSHA